MRYLLNCHPRGGNTFLSLRIKYPLPYRLWIFIPSFIRALISQQISLRETENFYANFPDVQRMGSASISFWIFLSRWCRFWCGLGWESWRRNFSLLFLIDFNTSLYGCFIVRDPFLAHEHEIGNQTISQNLIFINQKGNYHLSARPLPGQTFQKPNIATGQFPSGGSMNYLDRNGYPPNFREIAEDCNMAYNTVRRSIQILIRMKVIRMVPGCARTITIENYMEAMTIVNGPVQKGIAGPSSGSFPEKN